MSGTFIEEVFVSNYKCFSGHRLALGAPDGTTRGSGLNVLVGENGTGKTALLEAVNYTTQAGFAAENRLAISDFGDYRKPIQVSIRTNEFVCNMSQLYKDCTFISCGVEFRAKSRDQKSRGKLLSPPFSTNTAFITKGNTYRRKSGQDSGKEIPPLQKQFSNSSIDDSELNIFYFDKNRTRQLSPGTYKTTFERICDDLNWRFLKGLNDTNVEGLLDNIAGDYFNNVQSLAGRSAGKKLAGEMASFFNDEQYKNLRIDFVDLLHPFTEAFFSIREDKSLTQIRTRALGSGIEIVLTLLLLKALAAESKGGIVYLLDEPELHLHPRAQEKLAQLLLDEAATKQIVVATHSPYMIRSFMQPDVNKIVLRRDHKGDIQIENAKAASWQMFPWSPSWGEVNFTAFDIATVEYHNELYGWLKEHHKLPDEKSVEAYLTTKGISKTKSWTKEQNGKKQAPMAVTVCTYVRNSIHHPENRHNPRFTEAELRDSVDALRAVI